MRKSILFLFLLSGLLASAQHKSIQPYMAFLEQQEHKTAKDYILEKFKTHDIIILCERHHGEFSQYELITEILADPYFKKEVKNLFTEIGVVDLQPEIAEFLNAEALDSISIEEHLVNFQRNATFWAIWDNYNYYYLLKTLYNLNQNTAEKIHYYPSDVRFNWDEVTSLEDYIYKQDNEVEPRDSLIAANIINTYEKIKSSHKKALIILNYRHAFKRHMKSSTGMLNENAGKYLADYFGKRAFFVLSNRPVFIKKGKTYAYELIQDGKWDATFKYLKLEDMGFDLDETPFGVDHFDMWDKASAFLYQDIFDGFVFYKPIEEHPLISYFEGLISPDFEQEFIRRFKMHMSYLENDELVRKLDDPEFRKRAIREFNTQRILKYPNFEQLIKSRDKYLMN